MTLRMDSALLAFIHKHAEDSYPHEGAGFLLGRDRDGARLALRAIPHANEAPEASRARRYEIAPRDVMATEMEADGAGLEVVGIFHSHPDHPPVPSETDLKAAHPWYSYLITSVEAGTAARSRSWRLSQDGGQLVEEELTVQSLPGDVAR